MTRDLIDRSGREHLTFAERATWLRNEALVISHARARLGAGAEVHTLGVLLCQMSDVGSLHPRAAVARGVERHLAHLAIIECDVMAYRRGGARAVDELHRLRREIERERAAFRDARVRWKYPLWSPVIAGPFDPTNPWLDIGGSG